MNQFGAPGQTNLRRESESGPTVTDLTSAGMIAVTRQRDLPHERTDDCSQL